VEERYHQNNWLMDAIEALLPDSLSLRSDMAKKQTSGNTGKGSTKSSAEGKMQDLKPAKNPKGGDGAGKPTFNPFSITRK
jgi:hypothetical protein